MNQGWSLKFRLSVPIEMIAVDENGKFLPTMEFKSYPLDTAVTLFDDMEFYFEKYPHNENKHMDNINGEFYEWVNLCCIANSENSRDAIKKSLPHVEWICDQLAFLIQRPIEYAQIHASCLATPNETEEHIIPIQPPKFRNEAISQTYVNLKIAIYEPQKNFTEREFALFRWYHKSLSANYDIDKFVFLWICLEILLKIFDKKVLSFYTAPCGHKIEICPECNSSTEKEVNGKSLISLLMNELNTSELLSKEMWRFRQFIHGQNKLTQNETDRLTTLVCSLQAAIALGIKKILGGNENNHPIVLPEPYPITQISISGAIEK